MPLEPIPMYNQVTCTHPQHFPPESALMYIPAGMQYRHVCPACGKETIVRSSNYNMWYVPTIDPIPYYYKVTC